MSDKYRPGDKVRVKATGAVEVVEVHVHGFYPPIHTTTGGMYVPDEVAPLEAACARDHYEKGDKVRVKLTGMVETVRSHSATCHPPILTEEGGAYLPDEVTPLETAADDPGPAVEAVSERLAVRIRSTLASVSGPDATTIGRLGAILFGPYDDDVVALRGVHGVLRTDPDNDRIVRAMLHAVRTGDVLGFSKAVRELDRLYVYAATGPTRFGFHALLHLLNMCYSSHLRARPGAAAVPTLVGPDESASYDPETQVVRGQTEAAADLADLHEIHPTADFAERKLALLREVYDAATTCAESFESDDMIGPDFAYFVGSILKGTVCSWPQDRPFVLALRGAFPDQDHPVWQHITIEEDA